MPSRVLVDTDVLIEFARGQHQIAQLLNRLETAHVLAISVVTHMELLVGARNKAHLRKMDEFIRRFSEILLDERISETAVDLLRRYRLSHGLLLPDTLIAATAVVGQMPLLTRNQRDFQFIDGLDLMDMT